MSGSPPVRPLRALLGVVLIALGACLICWAVFNVLRGPSECGGDAPACPDGFLPAVLGGFGAVFLVLPVGIALAPKVAGLPAAIATVIAGGLATTVYWSRFVADPITESTVGTWIAVGVLGTVAVLSLLATLRPGPSGEQLRERLQAAQEDQQRRDAPSTTASASPTSTSSTSATTTIRATARTDDGDVDLGIDAIRQLLVHGLANGELATKVEVGRIAPDRRPDVQRLLDLHSRGVIDDDALRDALAALRSS